MNKINLKKELDDALNTFNKEANCTIARYSNNEQLKEALSFVYKDVFDCLNEFQKAIIRNIQ